MNKKYFCIGLHKTGTTSLHRIALNSGLKSIHSCDWGHWIGLRDEEFSKYDFFCDGGSHYNIINEIDYEYLYDKYPNSIFIINIREPRSWLISKLNHAGWDKNTIIITPDQKLINTDLWYQKTKKNIKLFICHYFDRYIKILEYFVNKQDRGYIVDVASGRIVNLKLLFQKQYSNQKVHANKGRYIDNRVSNEILEFIDNEINIVNRDKYEKLNSLLRQYNY